MANDFSFLKFVEHTGIPLIQKYFEKQGIPCSFGEKAETATITDFIKGLPLSQFRKVEEDFLQINEMSDEKSSMDLMIESKEQNVDFPELQSAEARAMWFFINHPEIFEAACVWDKIADFKNWQDERIDGDIDENTDWEEKAKNLTAQFKKHFWDEEERKIECYTEVFKHQDRVSFVVYPEGHPKAALKYDENGKIKHYSARPIQEVYFVLHLKEKKLSVKPITRYPHERVSTIKGLFFQNVLDQEFHDILAKEFELSHFLEENIGSNLKDKLPPGDSVEFVKIVEMAFKDRDFKGQITILKANDRKGDPKEIYEMLRDRNIIQNNVYVQSVKIQVKFPGRGRLGSCTFGLFFPNRHDLGKDANSLRCREYLKIWNIIKSE